MPLPMPKTNSGTKTFGPIATLLTEKAAEEIELGRIDDAQTIFGIIGQLAGRCQQGIRSYGSLLCTNDGRPVLHDIREEALDLFQYIVKDTLALREGAKFDPAAYEDLRVLFFLLNGVWSELRTQAELGSILEDAGPAPVLDMSLKLALIEPTEAQSKRCVACPSEGCI